MAHVPDADEVGADLDVGARLWREAYRSFKVVIKGMAEDKVADLYN